MKNLPNLMLYRADMNLELDKISNDINDLETELKNSAFSSYIAHFPSIKLKLYWDENKRRLLVLTSDETLNKPLIECKAYIRKMVHPFLDEFIDGLIAFMNLKQQPTEIDRSDLRE